MPTFKYTNQPNKKFELLPDGDYLLEIVAAEPKISQQAKYRGSPQIEMTFRTPDGAEFSEWLTFHEELNWKVDNFLTCFNYGVKEGQEIDVTPEGVMGLRGYCAVGHYESSQKKIFNQVKVYYTDKQKFTRAFSPTQPEAASNEEAPPWAQ